MRRTVVSILLWAGCVAAIALCAGCGGGERAHNAGSRYMSPTMTGEGMDGGPEPSEPSSYLRHIPR